MAYALSDKRSPVWHTGPASKTSQRKRIKQEVNYIPVESNSRYSPKKLRELRNKKGVGNSKHIAKTKPANKAKALIWPLLNIYNRY